MKYLLFEGQDIEALSTITMSSDQESNDILRYDQIIIEEVKKRSYLYDSSVSTFGFTLKERRERGFQSIADLIKRELDLEPSGNLKILSDAPFSVHQIKIINLNIFYINYFCS